MYTCYLNRNSNEKDTKLGKTLAWLLRHGAVNEGLTISTEGYISLFIILQHKAFRGKYNSNDIERVVNNDSKKRYKIRLNNRTNSYEVKANQGHSITLVNDTELIPILEPKYETIHGTYLLNWAYIKKDGLSRMNRKHIHFANGLNALSGIRKNIQILIYIDLAKALSDGLKFYESENGVILTEGNEKGYLEPKYFLKVIKIKSGEQIHP